MILLMGALRIELFAGESSPRAEPIRENVPTKSFGSGRFTIWDFAPRTRARKVVGWRRPVDAMRPRTYGTACT